MDNLIKSVDFERMSKEYEYKNLFPTWVETKQKTGVSEDEFLGFFTQQPGNLRAPIWFFTFINYRPDMQISKARSIDDIKQWMEDTGSGIENCEEESK